ncbi:MAG: helix-turn-helix transcriptional regulator [Parafilimonas sp.]
MSIVNSKVLLISERIRERREQLNYTQQYVAGKLKITQNAYSKIECGYSSLNVARMYEIAVALETDIHTFLIQ